MKGRMIFGLITGTVIGAATAWALSGDLNARGMMRISRRIERSANKMGMDK